LARGDLTDAEWELIEALLPSERGRKSRPAQDNRRYLNGMLHVLRVGCPWRDMHERYGKWNSVYVRFRRWAEQGVWDGLLETLVDLGLTDDWQHMIDSTTVRGHSQAAGAKGGLIRRLLVDHAAALRRKSTPEQTVKDALSALSRQAARSPTTVPFPPFWRCLAASPDCSWLTRDTMAMSCVKACCSLVSARSFRQSQTAGSRYLAISEPTRTGTGSSEFSTRSNSSAGSPPDTTKPRDPLPPSSISQPHASGYETLSTEPNLISDFIVQYYSPEGSVYLYMISLQTTAGIRGGVMQFHISTDFAEIFDLWK